MAPATLGAVISGGQLNDAMLIGLMVDVHDHLKHLRTAVEVFNRTDGERVFFARDLVRSMKRARGAPGRRARWHSLEARSR